MFIFELSLLFMSWAQTGEYTIIAERAPIVAKAAQAAVAQEGPLFDGEDGVDATEKLLMRIAYLESRGNFKAINPNGGDAGILQLRNLTKVELSYILSSPEAGMVMGLRRLHQVKATCGGSAERWLGAYASGKCGGAPKVARIRCAPLGLCGRT
jgi:hypothetical protein